MSDPLACTDLIAHRRYAYAKAAAQEGDYAAAAEILEQALERTPTWPPALFALAEAREKLGDADAAASAYRACLAADPSDAQGAGARLALLGAAPPPAALPEAYIARLFDDYAPRFEAHLIGELAYRGPALIAGMLESVAGGRRFARAIDLGCGAGLMGEAIRSRAARLEGVDLSAAMVAKARARGLYDGLAVGEIVGALEAAGPDAFDLVLAADVLVYVGDLAALFAAARGALTRDGLFLFTVEAFDGEGFRLRPTMRYAHAKTYIATAAAAAGLALLAMIEATTRREAGAEVAGLVCAFASRTTTR